MVLALHEETFFKKILNASGWAPSQSSATKTKHNKTKQDQKNTKKQNSFLDDTNYIGMHSEELFFIEHSCIVEISKHKQSNPQ